MPVTAQSRADARPRDAPRGRPQATFSAAHGVRERALLGEGDGIQDLLVLSRKRPHTPPLPPTRGHGDGRH